MMIGKRTPLDRQPHRLELPEETLRPADAGHRVHAPAAEIRRQPSLAAGTDPLEGHVAVQDDPAADALAKAKELLGGVDSAID